MRVAGACATASGSSLRAGAASGEMELSCVVSVSSSSDTCSGGSGLAPRQWRGVHPSTPNARGAHNITRALIGPVSADVRRGASARDSVSVRTSRRSSSAAARLRRASISVESASVPTGCRAPRSEIATVRAGNSSEDPMTSASRTSAQPSSRSRRNAAWRRRSMFADACTSSAAARKPLSPSTCPKSTGGAGRVSYDVVACVSSALQTPSDIMDTGLVSAHALCKLPCIPEQVGDGRASEQRCELDAVPSRLALVRVRRTLLRVLRFKHALHSYARALVHVASMRVHVTNNDGSAGRRVTYSCRRGRDASGHHADAHQGAWRTNQFESKSNRVKGIAFHPKLPLLAASLHNGSIQLWNYQTGTIYERLEDHEGPVRSISFHPT